MHRNSNSVNFKERICNALFQLKWFFDVACQGITVPRICRPFPRRKLALILEDCERTGLSRNKVSCKWEGSSSRDGIVKGTMATVAERLRTKLPGRGCVVRSGCAKPVVSCDLQQSHHHCSGRRRNVILSMCADLEIPWFLNSKSNWAAHQNSQDVE